MNAATQKLRRLLLLYPNLTIIDQHGREMTDANAVFAVVKENRAGRVAVRLKLEMKEETPNA
jgi:RNase H-fold protein (predicted Holliday junction resolvase)